MTMAGFGFENSKLKVFLIAKDEKQISLRMSLTKALYTVHASQLVWYGVVWCGVVWYGVVWYGVVWYGVVWCGIGY